MCVNAVTHFEITGWKVNDYTLLTIVLDFMLLSWNDDDAIFIFSTMCFRAKMVAFHPIYYLVVKRDGPIKLRLI
jgi:hypothetical protein